MPTLFPQRQLFAHEPAKGTYGDCHRTAIACVLGLPLDQVPHFLHDDPPTPVFQNRERKFLASQGLVAVTIAFEQELDTVLAWTNQFPNAAFILAIESERGFGHSVVVKNGRVVCDPASDEPKIDQWEKLEGYFWLTVLTPLIEYDEVA